MSLSELNSLNEAEKHILRLLAEGHTVKSAATLIEASPSALNERLREARRKTGAGSSRELARELVAQENRDNEIGVAVETTESPIHPTSSAPTWRSRKGWITVATLILVGTAAVAALLNPQPAPTAPTDPLLGQALPDRPSPAEWQKRLRAETRDGVWASKAEKALQTRYALIGNLGEPASALRVTCGATICEVAALMRPATQGDGDRIDTTMRELQGPTLVDALAKDGLKFETTTFTTTDSEPRRSAVFTYVTRMDG